MNIVKASILMAIALAAVLQLQSRPPSLPEKVLDQARANAGLLCTGLDLGVPCADPASTDQRTASNAP